MTIPPDRVAASQAKARQATSPARDACDSPGRAQRTHLTYLRSKSRRRIQTVLFVLLLWACDRVLVQCRGIIFTLETTHMCVWTYMFVFCFLSYLYFWLHFVRHRENTTFARQHWPADCVRSTPKRQNTSRLTHLSVCLFPTKALQLVSSGVAFSCVCGKTPKMPKAPNFPFPLSEYTASTHSANPHFSHLALTHRGDNLLQ